MARGINKVILIGNVGVSYEPGWCHDLLSVYDFVAKKIEQQKIIRKPSEVKVSLSKSLKLASKILEKKSNISLHVVNISFLNLIKEIKLFAKLLGSKKISDYFKKKSSNLYIQFLYKLKPALDGKSDSNEIKKSINMFFDLLIWSCLCLKNIPVYPTWK